MYNNKKLINPRVKDILLILGVVGVVSASLVIPGLPMALKPIINYKKKKDWEKQQKAWKKYNPYLLKHLLRRLQIQKDVEFISQDKDVVIKITEKGRTKFLKYQLDEMLVKDQRWDGKWRLIIYDVPERKKAEREIFRGFLKRLKAYQLQKSVYLTPYKCDEEIEYVRTYFGIGAEVIYLTIEKLENDTAYRQYFGL